MLAGRRGLRNAALLVSLLLAAPGHAKSMEAPLPDPFAEKTKSAQRRDGLLVTWLDAKAGKFYLELPKPSGPRNECGRFLYLEAIRTGLGSNPVGLDRGQAGETRVVTFRRVGARVLLEQPNLRYRAQSTDSNEVRTVRESFASSVLWGGEIAAEAADGRLLVDLTPFIVRDAHGAIAALRGAGQGGFSLDRERSALDPDNCQAFPDNLEFEALLTLTGEEPGREVRETAPTPQAITLVQHQSLVRLPDDHYKPRVWDPRSGSFDVLFADYAQPIASDLEVRWLVRHRLEKVDPGAARSRVRKPIVYYVDPGAPEPIRSALIEGATWWAQAFDAAGFIDAFQVRLLPAGADPLDVRYNVLQWVHRATRGWSYGGGIIDPRTGEMIKGQVTLGSLRIRQDRMIFEGLAGAGKTGTGAADDPVQLSLARIRQLAAHEVGHTLGFAHNFAASTYGRGSVMDYPAPMIGVNADGTLDFSRAYATGIGAWDIQQVRYAYTQFPPGADERAGLEAILAENRARGYLYLSDADTRPAGAAHPLAAMWDNGADPIAELGHEMAVRRIALSRFGEQNLRPGAQLGTLAEVLVPLYFHHRYQLEAAAKSIGGLDYAYTVVWDGTDQARPVPAARQRAALGAVLETLEPAALDLPESLLVRLAPPAADYPPRHEFFDTRTAPAFDALGAAATACDLTLSTLLPPERLARLTDFHRRDPAMPGADEVLATLVRRVFEGTAAANARQAEIRRTVQATTVRRLILAAAAPVQTPAARAALESALSRLATRLSAAPKSGAAAADQALQALLARDIRRFLSRPAGPVAGGATTPGAAPDLPPGPPIGEPGGLGGWDAADECEWSPGEVFHR
jgi:hypothetical protein